MALAVVSMPAIGGAQPDAATVYDFVEQFDVAEIVPTTGPRPASDQEAATLTIPAGAALTYYTKVAPNTVLVIDEVAPSANTTAGQPRLRVDFQAGDDGAVQTLNLPAPKDGRVSVPLPATTAQPAKLTLAAVSEPPGSAEVTIRLTRPTLRSVAAAPARAPAASVPAELRVERPNVIIYLIDTLRADHLGCYGYPQPTSPRIDAFAAESTRFTRAVAQSSWTRTTVASILTGQDPYSHGVHDTRQALPDEAVTLAEILSADGYDTAAFTTNASIVRKLGFAQGFRTFDYLNQKAKTAEVYQYSDKLNERAFAWLAKRKSTKPFFLYLHATDPHAPYTPPSPYRERFAAGIPPERGQLHGQRDEKVPVEFRDDLIKLYDGEIANNDEHFGALIDHLRELGLYDSTLLILVADHGEEFYDHGGWFHGYSVYQEQLHIPLIMRFPRGHGAGVSIESIVRQVDIAPTILDYLATDVPAQMQGESVLPFLAANGDQQTERPAFASRLSRAQEMDTVTIGSMKLIRNIARRQPDLELYDLSADPRERNNLAGQKTVTAGYMRTLLVTFVNGQKHSLPVAPVELNEAQKERLRALGYGD